MVNGKEQIVAESDVPRRRGRPAGKNRVPLSREERRARNAQYERERRNETAEVMSQLIEAVNCDPDISNADLLATVISRIQRASRRKPEDIKDLERINADLEAQIAMLQNQLGLDDASFELLDNENNNLESISPHSTSETNTNTICTHEDYNLRSQTRKRKRSERLSTENIQQEKKTKSQSETWSFDTGIELRGHTVSPALCAQDNMQYRIQSEQQQLPVEITEEQDHDVSPAHAELQTELYNQIYNSESQSSVESMPGYVGTSSSESIPCMESLFRSLVVVPTIISPQELYKIHLANQMQPESPIPQNVEIPCVSNAQNQCDFLPRHDDEQPTMDFLTDTEKGLLTDWISTEFLKTSGFKDDTEAQVRSYPIEDILSGYR